MVPLMGQIQNVQPTSLHEFILIVAGLVGIGAGVAVIYRTVRKQRIEPQPLDVGIAGPVTVKNDAGFVSQSLCQSLHSETDRRITRVEEDLLALHRELKTDRETSDVSARQRSAGIYSKIDEVRKELAAANEGTRGELARGFKDVERAIGRLEGKINGSPT